MQNINGKLTIVLHFNTDDIKEVYNNYVSVEDEYKNVKLDENDFHIILFEVDNGYTQITYEIIKEVTEKYILNKAKTDKSIRLQNFIQIYINDNVLINADTTEVQNDIAEAILNNADLLTDILTGVNYD